jgi:hypothetical protein
MPACRRTVLYIPDGRWHFTSGRDRLFGHADEALQKRLRRAVLDDDPSHVRAKRILACAALEGRRFTAPAVAAAGGWDSDETIDFLDDVLSVGVDRPDGLVIDDGFETVTDEGGARHLAVYCFARELDWDIQRHHGLSDAEQRHLAPRLATAIEALYPGFDSW